MSEETVKINRGLKGVYFDRSQVTHIDGRKGVLLYRGYSIHDLAEYSSFEETAYLLLFGKLPNATQLVDFTKQLRTARHLPEPVYNVIRTLQHGHPMDVLRSAVSALSVFDNEKDDKSTGATIRKGIRLTSQIAMIVCAHHRLRNGLEPVAPDPALSHAGNFLYMLKGEPPSEESTKLMDTDMILHAEHGTNASSFTARVVASTEADLHAAITAAIAALSGPAHGGAAEDVMKMAMEVGEPANAADYVKQKRARREPVMGFGHRVYRAEDPRARHLREGVARLSREMGQPQWYAILEAIEAAMRPYGRHGVNVNVDFYAGVIYYLHGIPPDLFVPIFAVGRVPGWVVQVLEQMENNILLRPLTLYNGPALRAYKSIGERNE